MFSFARCFNPDCEQVKLERSKIGWRLRIGEFAELCERCGALFEEGTFCETFHPNASGWRCCERCSKRIHCGCIVSAHEFLLLDAGGVECVSCSKAKTAPTPNTRWPMDHGLHLRNPPWKRSHSLFSAAVPQREKPLYDFDKSLSIHRITVPGKFSFSSVGGTKTEEVTQVPRKEHPSRVLNHGAAGAHLPEQPKVEGQSNNETRTEKSRVLSRYRPIERLKAVVTPLFEKMLSASDAGRVGRLVLPKKCAEAYFPPVDQPEGMPLQVQDVEGREWMFQFRFWPNNNSRMYVLEGVTPYIQSLKLQAGDTVTFNRLEPEGKLLMGYRKAWTSATAMDVRAWSEVEPSIFSKRRRKRAREEAGGKVLELKLTWAEAQGLLRPPSDNLPRVVLIEGFEFEEYEEPPLLGRPTVFFADNENLQWVQCEDCLKWRRIPGKALLPWKWTCSRNSWDRERSRCEEAQEISSEAIHSMLRGCGHRGGVAITTKHPRHRPGCSCVVCVQRPSRRSPKHGQACACGVCSGVRRCPENAASKRTGKKEGQRTVDGTAAGKRPPSACQIDLNIRPERDEEQATLHLPPPPTLMDMLLVVEDAIGHRQQRLLGKVGAADDAVPCQHSRC